MERHERNANSFAEWLSDRSVEFGRKDTLNSIYFDLSIGDKSVSVRFSNHAQPVAVDVRGNEYIAGGYSQSTGGRNETADHSVHPGGMTMAAIRTVLAPLIPANNAAMASLQRDLQYTESLIAKWTATLVEWRNLQEGISPSDIAAAEEMIFKYVKESKSLKSRINSIAKRSA